MATDAGVDDAARPGLTPAEVVRRSAAYLERHGVESPTANAETLLMNLLGTDRAALYARREGLDARTARLYGRALCRRCAGTPLQHITGDQQFLDLRLRVVPGVFVPRPETEILATTAIDLIAGVEDPVVVDVGTGTGAVALAVRSRRPDARVLATDLSPAAVDLARANSERCGLDVETLAGDLLAPVPPELRGRVDLVVSNPPYLTPEDYEELPEEVRRDPFEALVGGVGGLDVQARLAADAPAWLRPGGWLVVEMGETQAEDVTGLMTGAGFADIRVTRDLAGRDRVASARLAV